MGVTNNQARRYMYDHVFRARLQTCILPENRKHNRSISCASVISMSSNVSIRRSLLISVIIIWPIFKLQESGSIPALYSCANQTTSSATEDLPDTPTLSSSPEPSDHLDNIQAIAYQKGCVWYICIMYNQCDLFWVFKWDVCIRAM